MPLPHTLWCWRSLTPSSSGDPLVYGTEMETPLEDIEQSVRTLVAAKPDAIQLTPGQAPVLQRIQLRDKPALVLRTDVANVYGNQLDDHIFSTHFPDAVEQTIRLDAACVVAVLAASFRWKPGRRTACMMLASNERQTVKTPRFS